MSLPERAEPAERIREAVRDHGPIGFDEFMEHALYGRGGFFERHPVGADRHFVTSPHAQPFVFAHCVRGALLESWSALGEPSPFRLVEAGAGDGTLARALLEAFEALGRPPVEYTAVEVGTGARESLETLGLRVERDLDALEPFEGSVIANELLDNLPFLLAEGGAGETLEIRVGLDGEALTEVAVPWDREPAPPPLETGKRTTVPTGAFAFVDQLARTVRRGSVLLIDYGERDGPAGGAHGYRDQRETRDLLTSPGTTDVTAGVDLGAVARHARGRGFEVHGPVAQSAALDALGYGRWADTMRETQAKLQREDRNTEAVHVWQTRSRASLLVDPDGWGRLWWMALTTPGLPAPAWTRGPG